MATEFRTGQLCDVLPKVNFWLSELDCVGSELTLASCGGYKGFGYHNCDDTQCVRITCEEEAEIPETQLLHGNTGILSIFHDDEIRSVCDTAFGEADATVACADLYGNPAFYSYTTGQQCDYETFWLDHVSCSGTETNIEECNHREWGVSDCDPLNRCVQLFCVGGGPSPPEIVPEPENNLEHDPTTAIISITRDGEGGNICDTEFDARAA